VPHVHQVCAFISLQLCPSISLQLCLSVCQSILTLVMSSICVSSFRVSCIAIAVGVGVDRGLAVSLAGHLAVFDVVQWYRRDGLLCGIS